VHGGARRCPVVGFSSAPSITPWPSPVNQPSAPVSWDLPGSVRIAFSTAADGDVRDPLRRARWLPTVGCTRPCAVVRQVHGAVIARVVAGEQPDSLADGMVTSDGGVALGVFGADCPGLVLAAPDALGVAHCGWRGTAAGIVGALARRLVACSRHPPTSWYGLVGPGISGPAYEVDAPVVTACAWPPGSVTPGRAGHAHLDLAAAIIAQCAELGITTVRRSGVCTASDARLWSYRRRGAGLVQVLAAWRA